ncbi:MULTISPECIES: iron-containing alcohol dehydrogenase family protein [Flammeovirga]|nr:MULTISPECIES: iron-containing alcohol dehydrogenase family protein [Flammeovirga]
MHKNFKNIDKIVYGKGSFNQIDDILAPKRVENDKFMVFIVDKYFEGKELADRIPAHAEDLVFFEDIDQYEPTTDQVDNLRDKILAEKGIPAGIIGIGGGSIMDIAKALSLMVTNEGSSQLYQGLNLVKKAGVYHMGVPTVAGTGAECSMTAVLTGPVKKLGLKCDWTVFNQAVLDPELLSTVERNQWFYTGMDCYIHCIEAESGLYFNAYSKAYGDQALSLCREIYLGDNAGQNLENDEKLMIASLFGGLSLTYSEVGACHALSYGLSKILGTRHGYANCLAFYHLEEFYGDAVNEFKSMIEKHNIDLPQGLSKEWSEETIDAMAEVAYNLPHMWNHAIGLDWKEKWTKEDIKKLYRRL